MLRRIIAAAVLVWLTTVLAGCRVVLMPLESGTPSPEDMVNTMAAQTVSALGTKISAGGNVTLQPIKSITPNPSSTFTLTPKPKATNNQAQDSNCTNLATFTKDITIPDGSTILPNSTFTKTWELQNNGTCTWNANYSLVFANKGNSMSGPGAKQMMPGGEVKPGEKVNVSVDLRAPNDLGDYEGYWMLRDANNQTFGLGQAGAAPFFVKIHVAEEYTFAEHVCSAEWSSNAGKLACPGKDGDGRGFVLPLTNPTMEDNQQREGLGWLSMPQPVAGGYIVGKFPAVVVPNRSDFRTTISCAPGADGCYVHFKITYRVDNGAEQLLGEWNEGYEGGVTDVIKDLNMVSGKSTAFYFYVDVTGTPNQSKAIWFAPRIIKN